MGEVRRSRFSCSLQYAILFQHLVKFRSVGAPVLACVGEIGQSLCAFRQNARWMCYFAQSQFDEFSYNNSSWLVSEMYLNL